MVVPNYAQSIPWRQAREKSGFQDLFLLPPLFSFPCQSSPCLKVVYMWSYPHISYNAWSDASLRLPYWDFLPQWSHTGPFATVSKHVGDLTFAFVLSLCAQVSDATLKHSTYYIVNDTQRIFKNLIHLCVFFCLVLFFNQYCLSYS